MHAKAWVQTYMTNITDNLWRQNLVFFSRKYLALFLICISTSYVLSNLVQATETTYDISAIMRKEAELGEGIKFDMFLHGSVTFDVIDKIKPDENITGSFGFNPATVMIFLDIPSINRTYATETEVPLEDLKPITVFDGVTLIIDLMPSAALSVSGPASLNQTNIFWENFLEKKSFTGSIYSNVSKTETIRISSEFYLNAKISVNIQLQNYTTEIINYPIPQMEMLPKISHIIEIESTPTIFDALGNPVNLIFIVVALTLIIIVLLTIRKYIIKKDKNEISIIKTKQTEDFEQRKRSEKSDLTIFCIYCGEQLPAEATYCRKCGKKIK